jgi:hypothetical protein
MRYIDSGNRVPEEALGTWLIQEVQSTIEEVRWQSGFFTADALGITATTLHRLAQNGHEVKAVIGSNDGGTLRRDVERLAEILRIPRPDAYLGVVSFTGAYFHPKTYHFRRADGSQCAYVGSANFTAAGVASRHVEAGVILDTREGDPDMILNQIAHAVDEWFNGTRPGVTRITSVSDINALASDGVLAEAAPPRPPSGPPSAGGRVARPGLRPLIALPTYDDGIRDPGDAGEEQPELPIIYPPVFPAVPRAGFPAYLLFAPGANAPTTGLQALSGAALPSGAAGLVIRLNRDSARHFAGGGGTSNISIPVATLSSLRFGIYHGKYERPRAEYTLQMRYIGATSTMRVEPAVSNIMAYGFAPGESGHGDVRLVLPASVKTLAERVRSAELPIPEVGDVAILEWPTAATPELRLSFLEHGSRWFQEAQRLFDDASASGELVGAGACWLPPRISLAW